jgi:hypothetical protein
MVEWQRDKWPWTDSKRKFNASKTWIEVLKEALLDPTFGFTMIASPGNAENGGQVREGLEEGSPGMFSVFGIDILCAVADPKCQQMYHRLLEMRGLVVWHVWRFIITYLIFRLFVPKLKKFPFQHRTAHILIEDSRPTLKGLPPTKAVEVMELGMVKDIGRGSGEWHAHAHAAGELCGN